MNTSIKSISDTNERLCYVMDLKKEYGPNKVGKENYALITDMSETELKEIYGCDLDQYEPYVMMTLEMGEVIFESHRNDWKHLKRQVKYGCDYSVSDEEFDEHHPECAEIPDYLTYIAADEKYVQLHSAIKMLSPIQRERINKFYFEQMSANEIAGEENVSVQAIRKSLEKGISTLKELIENEQFTDEEE